MKKILITDDEPGVIKVLGKFLSRLKHEIISTSSGFEAIYYKGFNRYSGCYH